MKDSEIYLRAAEGVSGRHESFDTRHGGAYGCCDFIEVNCGTQTARRLVGEFGSLFFHSDGNPTELGYWMGYGDESNKARVLALLFMSAIAKSEGR